MAKGEKRLEQIRGYVAAEIERINPEYARDYSLEVRPVTLANAAISPSYFSFCLISKGNHARAVEVMQLSPKILDRKAETIKNTLAFSYLEKTLPALLKKKGGASTERGDEAGGLETVMVILSGASVLLGILFLFSNFTGNAIADYPIKTTSLLGVGMLVLGFVAGFFYVKRIIK